jgi:hypothetical protein
MNFVLKLHHRRMMASGSASTPSSGGAASQNVQRSANLPTGTGLIAHYAILRRVHMGSNHDPICGKLRASLRGTPAGTVGVDIKPRVGPEAACHHVRFVLGFALLHNLPLSLEGVRVCVSLHAQVCALVHA